MTYCIDTLVIGGGVQGLWILNELIRRNYRACLITNGSLGAGQTLQSHVFLHRGHLYDDRNLVGRITRAQPAWQKLIESADIRASEQKPVWILPADSADRRLETWRTLGLSYTETSLPEVFGEGEYFHGTTAFRAFETQERWLEGEALISALSAKVLPAIRTGHVEKIEIRRGRVQRVQASLADGAQVTFNPRFVVLAAGVGNQQLLATAVSFGRRAEDERLRLEAAGIQRLRTSQMVVVRGRSLPALGCISPGKMFLVSHKDGPDTVWLNSYETDDISSTPTAGAMPAVDPIRLKTSLRVLHSAAPRLKSMDVTYGVYTCLKSERNVSHRWVPSQEFVEPVGSPSLNIRVVWPSKLTLAPLASETVVEVIKARLSRADQRQEPFVPLPGSPPPVGVSDWRRAQCASLESLIAQHGLN
jgi:glycine/D-amino acid oxidase-like deaminating enzyme